MGLVIYVVEIETWSATVHGNSRGRNLLKIFLTIVALLLPAMANAMGADALFKANENKIYQVRVIDVVSGDKATIGSGFAIDANGMIATNYHVVSDMVQYPDRYRLQYRDFQGKQGELTIRAIDVVHDLALVQRSEEGLPYFNLSSTKPSQGIRMFSMGNPFDLGMTIIEGNYNGYLKYSMHEKILFSGSLNPGMSGGPAINTAGEVIGINVSTMGSDISFLVPVNYLQALTRQMNKNGTDFQNDIGKQLRANQKQLLSTLLESEWKLVPFGKGIRVPERISNFTKCWGNSSKEPKLRYRSTYRSCSTEDNIYLSSRLRTGMIRYQYNLLQNKDLNSFQFASLYQQRYKNNGSSGDLEDEENFTPEQCNSSIIFQNNSTWKVSFCTRKYKKYSGLNDMMLVMAQIGVPDQGVLFSMDVSGVEHEAGIQLLKKFSESFQWQN